MKKYAVWDEVFDIMANTSFERLTARQLIDAYFRSLESDAQIVSIFNSEEDAIDYLDRMEICHTKKIDFFSGLVHIAYVQQVEVDDNNAIVSCGAVVKTRVNA